MYDAKLQFRIVKMDWCMSSDAKRNVFLLCVVFVKSFFFFFFFKLSSDEQFFKIVFKIVHIYSIFLNWVNVNNKFIKKIYYKV